MSGQSVVVVEDEIRAREHLSKAVAERPELRLVAAAADFTDGLAALRRHAPDVLLTDLGLPDGDGLDLIKVITADRMDTEVMVVTVFGDERHVLQALAAGAGGYLLKDESTIQIGEAVLQLLAGGAPISPAIAKHLLKRFRVSEPAVQLEPLEPLTRREQEVLRLVSKGYTAVEIAELHHISYHTVNTHVKRIYKKLAVNTRAEAVFEAMRLGLVEPRYPREP